MLVIFCQINRHFVGLGLFSLEMASLYKRPLKGAFSIPRSHSQTPAKLVKADCMVRGNASASSCSQLKWPSKKPLNTQIKWQSHPCLGIVDIRRITALGGILKQWCLVCTLFPGQLKKNQQNREQFCLMEARLRRPSSPLFPASQGSAGLTISPPAVLYCAVL